MRFYLGTHMPNWLALTDAPLFVSHRRLSDRRTLPVARGRWALDSGGFTELSMFGEWRTPAAEYVAAVRRYRDEIGNLDWASPQDWMCEPWIIGKTGLSVAEHQERTIANYLVLTALAPDLPFVPVLQGWHQDDYHAHADAYRSAGVDLSTMRVVGVGSVCRRQNSEEAAGIIRSLAARGIALHGFGFKLTGLRLCNQHLASADSMAWSYNARRSAPLHGCTHKSCANCLRFALAWRERVLRACSVQRFTLFEEAVA